MGLDLRWPIGLMFSLVGVLLVIYGAATGSDPEIYRRSLDININLIWGVVLVVFGLSMLMAAMNARRVLAGLWACALVALGRGLMVEHEAAWGILCFIVALVCMAMIFRGGRKPDPVTAEPAPVKGRE